jgi:hypothetical protein
MSTFTSTNLVKQTRAKGIDPGTRIDKDRYDCYMAVDTSTADVMHVIVYLRKDQSMVTPSTLVWTYSGAS